VQALLDFIDNDALTVDALLVPGDLANKACQEGLNQGWDYCLELAAKLHARSIIPVIGNHDIDSKRLRPEYGVFSQVRDMRPDFPFAQAALNQSYFSDGYCVITTGDVQFIALNTVIDQTDEASAKNGTFSNERIGRMEAALSLLPSVPLTIAIMHHHPILHSGGFWGDRDVIPTGDALVAALRRLGCRLIIHGHKHIPRLSIVDGVAVFASGSFSASLHEYGTLVGNTFHVIELHGEGPHDVKGKITTWVFQLGRGWTRSNEDYRGFPYVAGFGSRMSVATVAERLIELANDDLHQTRFLQDRLFTSVPDIEHLTPSQREELNQMLAIRDLKVSSVDGGHIELWRIYRP
jgi:3',5'-cyclic AMP phosphodiesterase CpdA